jgi:hypothetical protein
MERWLLLVVRMVRLGFGMLEESRYDIGCIDAIMKLRSLF